MVMVLFIALTVVVGFHLGTGACPTHCKAGQTCDADDAGCPECDPVYYGRQCQHRMECRFTSMGAEYRGLRNTSNTGKTCQRWDSQKPHSHRKPALEENYCRNPDGEPSPWCYTTDPNSRFDLCDVKMCNTQCPSPSLNAPRVDVTNPPSDGFAVGFNAVIGCITGYETTGSPATVTVTCQSSLKWTQATLPTCNKVKCPTPLVANSVVNNPKPKYKYQDTITIVCATGYTLQGQSTLTCQADKSWSASFPTCNINECPSPAAVGNGSMSGIKDKYVYKDSVTIVCDIGYTIVGQETIQCQADKTWSTAPKCDRVKCRQPPLKANSKVSDPKSEYEYQDSITIVCDVGYFLEGQNNITCQGDASWKPTVPVCIINSCDQPKLSNNSKMVVTKRTFQRGDTVEFFCETGFNIQGPTQLTCLGNKTWNMEPPTCKLAECTLPSLPATIKLQNPKNKYFYGDYISFFCTEGHEFQGRNTSDCKATSQWSEPFPVCEKIKCTDLKLSSNVLISSPKKNTYSYDDKVSFQCQEGFKLSHDNYLVCRANKLWDKEEPYCFEVCNGLSTSQVAGITVGSNIVVALLSIFVTVLFMRRFITKDKTNDKPPASVIKTCNAAFDNYDAIDVDKKEQHIYNLPE